MEFPRTQWTQLARASQQDDPHASASLQEFCEQYRTPVMGLIRSQGVVDSRVQELTTAFFHHLADSAVLKRADREVGSFRRFLCAALQEFLASTATPPPPAAGASHDPAVPDSPAAQPARLSAADEAQAARLLNREWALHLVSRALRSVRKRWLLIESPERFAILRAFLPGATETISPHEAAERLGLTAEAFEKDLRLLRQSLRDEIRKQIAETVSSHDEITEEMRLFGDLFQGARAPHPPGTPSGTPDRLARPSSHHPTHL